jgi:hypothetical protein
VALSPPEAPTLILCDFAEVITGKLYVMGAGIAQVAANIPVTLCLAAYWLLPWDRANRPNDVEFVLDSEDGSPFQMPDGNDLKIMGRIEVGRPPGTKPGSPLFSPIALRIPPLVYPPGGYVWTMRVNGTDTAYVSFQGVGG